MIKFIIELIEEKSVESIDYLRSYENICPVCSDSSKLHWMTDEIKLMIG
jgi:hypothetical protein